MHRIYTRNPQNARRISAHRQNWFNSNSSTLSTEQKINTDNNIQQIDTQLDSVWLDHYSQQRTSVAIHDLINAQNVRARSIAAAVDADRIEDAVSHSRNDAPIKILNEILSLSHLPIEISVGQDERLFARENGSEPYSIVGLSDGERNALLLAATVLTVKPGTLILIDEPERHLHRSIISPLLTLLLTKRSDCSFVVSTHEVMLPLDNPAAQTLLIRNCILNGASVIAWDADLITVESEIDSEIRKDIIGARRKILFVEGAEQSLDKPLYSLIFPNVSVIAKSSSRDVKQAVVGIRDATNLHWVHAFGIVDSDRRTPTEIEALKEKGIYVLSVFSVESIYYHPDVQQFVATRLASVTGQNADIGIGNAHQAAIAAVKTQIQHLSQRSVERIVREEFFKNLPGRADIAALGHVNISIDVAGYVNAERHRLQQAIDGGDLLKIIADYPISETSMLAEVANKLGFQTRKQYESAVRKLVRDDADALKLMKSLFGTLAQDIEAA
jgi:hypothetical protein